jgi:eukaryotic-like serine/threonine-protein kinase
MQAEACRQCGGELDPDGLCAVCLLSGGFEPELTTTVIAIHDGALSDETGAGLLDNDRFGPYRILRVLGGGGMGTVYFAEQTHPLRRQVALKVVKLGLNSAEIVSRFNYERQALASMDHLNIARVYDAGASEKGRPYFVMEFVDGLPITDYCDRHRLNTRERLELYILVCQALQHAHQKGVIHRDIKPSNVMVTEVEGQPVPKIIDFGIARATEQRADQTVMFTQFGQFIGTPEYMSPEQADLVTGDVDTSSDVYSLGVLLYELLIGAAPFDAQAMRKAGLTELLRVIREDEAISMAAKLSEMGDTASELASCRRTDPKTLSRIVSGDLNWIVMRAMEKDRARRYPTAAELASDIRRYLEDQPVVASPPSPLYRARKFARRHFWALATVCAFAIVLIVATTVTVRQSLRANREAAAARAVNDFLQNDLLAQASASNQVASNQASAKIDPDLKVRTALDRAAVRIEGKFDRQPEVEASIRDTMGQTYMDLGLYAEAIKQLERARDLHGRVMGNENSKTAWSMSHLGRAELLLGKFPDSEKHLSRALEIEQRSLGSEHPDTLYSMTNLAVCYRKQGKNAEAGALQSQTLKIKRRVFGPEHSETLKSMSNLGAVYTALGKYQEAEVLDNQVLQVYRRILGPEHPNTLYSMTNLADDYLTEGKYGQAEALLAQTMEIENRLLGPENSATLHSMNFLAIAYYFQGKYAQAEALHEQTLETMRRVLGPEHLDSLLVMSFLATDLYAQAKFAQAEALFNQTLAIESRVLSHEHPAILTTRADLACMYQQWGKSDSAEKYAALALEGRRHTLGSEHPETMQSAADLALTYVSQGKFAQAETLAREVFEFQKKRPDDWERFRAESLLGASLAGKTQYAEAEPLLLEGCRGMAARKDRMGVPQHFHLDCAAAWIVQMYSKWGKPEKAAEWRKFKTASPMKLAAESPP